MRIIKVKDGREIGKWGNRILGKGIWEHPRRVEMDEPFTYIERDRKKILTINGTDSIAGEYELEFI